MEKYGIEINVADIFYRHFELAPSYSSLMGVLATSPLSIIYGATNTGKTFAIKKILEAYPGWMIYIKSSPIDWEKDNVINLDASEQTFDVIFELINLRKEKIKKGENVDQIMLVFDDILHLEGANTKFVSLTKLLAYSGRHYGFSTCIITQSYMQITKSIRGQASFFLSLLPIGDTYRSQIYHDYWKIFRSDRDLTELEKLPKHSFIVRISPSTRILGIADPKSETGRLIAL